MHSLTRPNIVSVGTIVWLSSELMFFAGLFAMYFTIRSVHPGDWPMHLPIDGEVHAGEASSSASATRRRSPIILVASSFTCQWGVFAAEKGDVFKLRRWFTLTFLMGLIFVLGQANEYRMQVARRQHDLAHRLRLGVLPDHRLPRAARHRRPDRLHLFLIRTTLGKFTPAQATAAIVVSYYWHFVDVVWIGLFATIYIIR